MVFNNHFYAPVNNLYQSEGNITVNAPKSKVEFNQGIDYFKDELQKYAATNPQAVKAFAELEAIKQQGQQPKQSVRSQLEKVAEGLSKAASVSDNLVKLGTAIGKWAAVAVALF